MNGGHSAAAMLIANPSLVVHSFDIMFWNYSWPVANMLKTGFGRRFILHPGDSRTTVKEWQAEVEAKQAKAADAGGQVKRADRPCDMLLVDGDHTLVGAIEDLRNLRPLAAKGAPVVVDDTASAPGVSLKAMVKSKWLVVNEAFGPYDPPTRYNRCLRTPSRGAMCLPWGFSIAQYVEKQ